MRINFFSAGIIYLALLCLVLIIGCKSFQTSYFGVEDEAITAPKEFNQTRLTIESAKFSADSLYAEKKIDEAMALGEEAAIAYWKCFDQVAKDVLALAQQSAYRAELFHPQPPPPTANRANATPWTPKTPESMESEAVYAGVIALPPHMIIETVYFGFDSYKLNPYEKSLLDNQVPVLKKHSDFVFEVAGHSDFAGPDSYNQILSQKRARSVIKYLSTNGVSDNHLYLIGYGESDPFYSNDTFDGQAKNRRSEIRVTGSLLPELALKNLDTLPAGTTLEVIHFNHNKRKLLPVYQALLDKAVPLIKGSPKVKLEIAGHSDNVGSKKKNLALSLKRASTVKDYLIAKGVSKNRLTTTVYASDQPIASNLSSIGKNLNRRVEIKVFE
ncbi:MAG: OmpA family protein [Desulfobacteraceae bacterium]|nr:OmpA family protein [Desulfobacteraceae bacterium]MBC2757730.1 OmpA family protein [Desulfobacteraceae bacterium]